MTKSNFGKRSGSVWDVPHSTTRLVSFRISFKMRVSGWRMPVIFKGYSVSSTECDIQVLLHIRIPVYVVA
jgi:hypothetical protein